MRPTVVCSLFIFNGCRATQTNRKLFFIAPQIILLIWFLTFVEIKTLNTIKKKFRCDYKVVNQHNVWRQSGKVNRKMCACLGVCKQNVMAQSVSAEPSEWNRIWPSPILVFIATDGRLKFHPKSLHRLPFAVPSSIQTTTTTWLVIQICLLSFPFS